MPTTQGLSVHIRWMVRLDMPQVMTIENASFDCPWLEEDFLATLRQRNAIGMVAESEGNVVGYMIYERHSDLRIHLVKFAVSRFFRRVGVGSKLMEKLKEKVFFLGASLLTVDVRETQLDFQLFLRSQGFKAFGVQRGMFDGVDGFSFSWSAT